MMRKKLKKMIVTILSAAMMLSSIQFPASVKAAGNEAVKQLDFYVYEDAFARKDRAGTNYNSDPISGAHDPAYDGKGYKAMNSKLYGTDEIITAMKVKLPP